MKFSFLKIVTLSFFLLLIISFVAFHGGALDDFFYEESHGVRSTEGVYNDSIIKLETDIPKVNKDSALKKQFIMSSSKSMIIKK